MSKSERKPYSEADLSKVKTFPMEELSRIVETDFFAKPMPVGGSLTDFVESLPKILAAKKLVEFAKIVAEAKRNSKAIIVMYGGHVIKTGLGPLLIDWMKRGIITAIGTHGAGVIHDTEIALFGRTSEDVAEGLADGSFGMSRDTADFINKAISHPDHRDLGYGESLGKQLVDVKAPCHDLSLVYNAYDLQVPLTVHVALGTDIIHQHPTADGEAIGRTSLRDFRILAHEVGKLSEGGVVMNLGSAVIMPEVFLKALSVARNLGHDAHKFTTANFDMITHYRPTQNVLTRPTLTGGKKFNFTGHHEIMIPLLHALVLGELSG
ncbi:MAG: hypothetical protein HN356_03090 [Calditrichaeota bacterium]|nr:hypothetical protein [Calditrichota bacterium]MBT7787269.1 hypothetical protein [Calditrichota bacterium]